MWEKKVVAELDDFKRAFNRYTDGASKEVKATAREVRDLQFKMLGLIDVMDAILTMMERKSICKEEEMKAEIHEHFIANRGFTRIPESEELREGDAVLMTFAVMDPATKVPVYVEGDHKIYSIGIKRLPFEEEFKGVRPGQRKEVAVKYPDDYSIVPALAGKEWLVNIEVKEWLRMRAMPGKAAEASGPATISEAGELVGINA